MASRYFDVLAKMYASNFCLNILLLAGTIYGFLLGGLEFI
jgi:hypothetical protein